MAESFSVERRKLMRFLGAKVVLTPAPPGAHRHGRQGQGARGSNGWFMTRQFENEANPDIHSKHHGAGNPRAISRARGSTTG